MPSILFIEMDHRKKHDFLRGKFTERPILVRYSVPEVFLHSMNALEHFSYSDVNRFLNIKRELIFILL